jgi:SAM-dependent methyltransferase
VLDLGRQPLANALVDPERADAPEPRYPLRLAVCERCALAQILEIVPPEQLFRKYVYFSSFSDMMVRHAEQSARELIGEEGLGARSLVLEVASNDGYQLQFFRKAGVPVLGIEPAANVAEVAIGRGIPTLVEFFGRELGERLRARETRVDVLLAYNVMAHVPDLNGFAAGIRAVLAPTGVAVIEVPHVAQLLARCEFDTIYHEHVFYFSLSALVPLLRRHGLDIFRVREIPLHGGSLRIHVALAGSRAVEPSALALLAREVSHGLSDTRAYDGFRPRVELVREKLVRLIDSIRARGERVAGYGAAAKGSTLLNYCGLDRRHVEFVVDRSPHKQGRCMPGVRVPILAPEALLERRPEYCLLLAWNLAEEILGQQTDYREAGGRFLVPLPEPRVV